MVDAAWTRVLDEARESADLTIQHLWLRYFALGGAATAAEVGAFLDGSQRPEPAEYDLLVDALNERFMELDRGRPIRYYAAGAPRSACRKVPPTSSIPPG